MVVENIDISVPDVGNIAVERSDIWDPVAEEIDIVSVDVEDTEVLGHK